MPSESLAALRSMVRSHEQPAAWLLERLGSGAAERAHEDAPLSARTGAAGARRRAVDSFEFELRGWFSEEEAAAMLGAAGTAGVAPEAVDRLEASLRRLLDGLALSAGSRARACQKLFLGAPRATATALSEGRAVSAAELGEALAALHVQWATAESARGLCARYAAAGPAGALDAASLVSGLFPETSAERARALLGRVREALAARGASGARTVQDTLRQFRLFDADGNGGVSRDEFKRGLALCLGGTALWPLGRADLELLFNAFDRNGDGRIAFEEFAHAAREPMTAQRIDLVLRAYERLCGLAGADPRGGLPLRAIGAAYDAAAHPRARDGRASAGRCLEAFLGGFDKDQDALVSAAEFVQYYTWHSWHLRGDDRAFERVLAESLRLGGLEGAARSALAHAQGATPPPLPAAWA
jgi:Ca2+-binding EF-hand superfamily protein